MRKTGLIFVLILSLLCCLPAEAQFGGIINMGKKAKEKVENAAKKGKGRIDFYYFKKQRGYYDSKNHTIVFNDLYKDGELKGKNVTFTIQDNGVVVRNDGEKVAELLDNGVINCNNCAPYCTLTIEGDVVMDGEVIGHINNLTGDVTMVGFNIGNVKGIDKQIAAYIIFGILHDKEVLADLLPQYKAERKRIDEEKRKAANHKKTWPIQINGFNKGYVDSDGTVYDWSKTKIGQLPKGGEGNITDRSGNIIGYIRNYKIYDKMSNLLLEVGNSDFYGEFTIPGSTDKYVVESQGNVVLQQKDAMMGYKDVKTLGCCNARPFVWVAALVVCKFFKF